MNKILMWVVGYLIGVGTFIDDESLPYEDDGTGSCAFLTRRRDQPGPYPLYSSPAIPSIELLSFLITQGIDQRADHIVHDERIKNSCGPTAGNTSPYRIGARSPGA